MIVIVVVVPLHVNVITFSFVAVVLAFAVNVTVTSWDVLEVVPLLEEMDASPEATVALQASLAVNPVTVMV